MSSRDKVFSNIKNALKDLPESARTKYPDWDDSLAVCRAHPTFDTVWDLFAHKCATGGGIALDGIDGLVELIKERQLSVGYCDPVLLPLIQQHLEAAGVRLETVFDPSRLDDYQFGITRASGAIAETGTVILKDRETSSRLGALAPWIHIAVVAADKVLPDTPSAIRIFGDDPNIIWATGPSRTADVEGILIEGVHGPGVQVCCKVPELP